MLICPLYFYYIYAAKLHQNRKSTPYQRFKHTTTLKSSGTCRAVSGHVPHPSLSTPARTVSWARMRFALVAVATCLRLAYSPSTHMAISISSRRTSTCLPTLILIFPARVHSSSSPVKSNIEPAFSDDHMLIDEYGSEYTSTFLPRSPLRVTNNQKPIDHCIIRAKIKFPKE